ncbi:MAG: N-acetylmuramoyl-L-alanine amidase [Rhodospirillales bacterium]|nr:N-acetylmuramoyl-L-alanine amidase [Rhodospirillales bacterium]
MWCKQKASRIILIALGVLASVNGLPRPADAADSIVTDVRVSESAQRTRVVFEFTRDLDFKVFTLANPSRVVVDMPEVGWQLPPQPLPHQIGVFETLRYGLYKPGNSRVVVDLRTPAVVKKAFLMEPSGPSGYRLVIDLSSASPSAFARQTKAPPIEIVSASADSFEKPKPPVQIRPVAKAPKTPTLSGPEVLSRSPAARMTVKKPETLKLAMAAPARAVAEAPGQEIRKLVAAFRPAPRKPAIRPGIDKKTIIVDSGHGGADPGTIGRSGIYEKHITLAMAKELTRQLNATGHFRAIMTRDRDIFIPLRERVKIARDSGADLFISLHADAVKNRKISGPSVYTLSEKASDKEAQALADKENKSDLIAGLDLSHESQEVAHILIDLAQRESMNQSARFATQLVKDLKRRTRLLRNTHRFAGFAVLKAPDIPSVLIEMGFLSNRNDERLLQTDAYRKKFSTGIVDAIQTYFSRVEQASNL